MERLLFRKMDGDTQDCRTERNNPCLLFGSLQLDVKLVTTRARSAAMSGQRSNQYGGTPRRHWDDFCGRRMTLATEALPTDRAERRPNLSTSGNPL